MKRRGGRPILMRPSQSHDIALTQLEGPAAEAIGKGWVDWGGELGSRSHALCYGLLLQNVDDNTG